ncbi:MAG: DUF2207 domain-containing protein [Candidatus Uhrbacteria bacterium]|nr:DUF2207 domain-containing protein [Candidatus Uhrbacteria bacterium]
MSGFFKSSIDYLYKSLIVTASILLFLVVPLSSNAQSSSDWQVSSFDSNIEVKSDGSFLITETVVADFFLEKHGIFRNIPVVYENDFGIRHRTPFNLLSVLQDGKPAIYDLSRSGANVVVRIGDPDITIEGRHEYKILYTVSRAMLYFSEYDEIFWNVSGDDWEAPFLKATALVTLPQGADSSQAKCYTGYFGSTREDCAIAYQDNSVAFASNDFLTIAVGFTKGVVEEPSSFDRFSGFMQDNWMILIPIIVIILVIGIWWKLGRDPRVGTIVAEYEPPEGMLAVYAGILTKNSISKWHVSSMIIQMAVLGYLRIRVEEDVSKHGIFSKKPKQTITLEKVKDGSDLDPAHSKLFNEIFKGRESVTTEKLKGSISQGDMQSIKSLLHEKIKKDGIYTERSFTRRNIAIVVAFILFAVGIFGSGITGALAGIVFFFAGLVTFLFGLLMPKKTLKGIEIVRRAKGFKLFMHTAERYRSEWHEKENMFEKYLPYAIAFADVDHWADIFKDMEFVPPDWYVSSVVLANPSLFVSDLTSVNSSINLAVSPPSSSGGSGGGGFSGGGFGGGGGGSW